MQLKIFQRKDPKRFSRQTGGGLRAVGPWWKVLTPDGRGLRRGGRMVNVNHQGAALTRVAGVAHYTPTKDRKMIY